MYIFAQASGILRGRVSTGSISDRITRACSVVQGPSASGFD